MQINKINNLLELFYKQYQRQNKESIFLQSLKEPKKKLEFLCEAKSKHFR